MINVSGVKPTVRETSAEWEYADADGKVQTEEIRVLYTSPTIKELKDRQAEVEAIVKKNKDAIFWMSDNLIRRLHSLPDLVDKDGKPIEITLEFLERQEVRNLKSLKDAIEADLAPKETPGK